MLRIAGSLSLSLSLALLSGNAIADESNVDVCANAAEESQALKQAGKLTVAREKLVTCARATCPAFIQKDCANWLAELEKTMPSIVVKALNATTGKDLTDVKVTIDGKVASEKLDGRPLAIDPGEHSITYEASGEAAVTEKILIRQAEQNRIVSVSIGARDKAAGPESPKKGGIPTASYVLGGVGLALAAVGGVMWLGGSGDHSDMESGCAKTRSCVQSDVDSAQTKLLIGDIAMGAGLVAIGAAVVYAVLSKGDSTTGSLRPVPWMPRIARH